MKKTESRPFGLSFLEEVPVEELRKINGGRRHKHHPTHPTQPPSGGQGPVLTTMHVSLPQPAFPQGDNG